MAAHQVSPRSVQKTGGIWTEERARFGEEDPELLTQRVPATLTPKETKLLQCRGEMIQLGFRELKLMEISEIYPKQEEAAKEIIDEFSDLEKVMMLALGLTPPPRRRPS